MSTPDSYKPAAKYRRFFLLLLASLTAQAMLLMPLPAVAQAAPGAPQVQQLPAADPCGEAEELKPGSGLCTHGPDPAPPGVDINQDVRPVSRAVRADKGPLTSAFSGLPTFECDGDGTSGSRVQLVYIHASDTPDRYDEFKESIQLWGAEANMIVRTSAQKTGGERQIRFVHDASCMPTVERLTVSPAGDGEFLDTLSEFWVSGLDDGANYNRNFILFVDANKYCGLGTLSPDHQPGLLNQSNNGGYSRIDAGCWSGRFLAHELGHNLGAVQWTAPNSTGVGHCNDDYDVMCYSDSPQAQYRIDCPDANSENLYDCNNDDYFHTDPPPGSYLDTHWNAANNVFLIGGGTDAVCFDQTVEPNQGPADAWDLPFEVPNPYTAPTMMFDKVFKVAFCKPGDQDWFTIPLRYGKHYRIESTDATSGAVPKIDVFAPNGEMLLVHGKTGPAGSTANIQPQVTGVHYLRVQDSGTTPAGNAKTYGIVVRDPVVTNNERIGGAVGYNGFGQTGLSPAVATFKPRVSYYWPNGGPGKISAGYAHNLGVTGEDPHDYLKGGGGNPYSWGYDGFGQLGGVFWYPTHRPQFLGMTPLVGGLGDLRNVENVSAGMLHSIALKTDGTVWAWGSNAYNQLGDGTTTDHSRPAPVKGLTDVVAIAAGSLHNLAVKSDGSVWTWGWNAFGQLGDGTLVNRSIPVRTTLSGVETVAGGLAHSVALDKSGNAFSWGFNSHGQLGDGTLTDRSRPVPVTGLDDAYQLSAGFLHTVALRNDGSVWAWGNNAIQQAGGGPDRKVPGPVTCAAAVAACPRKTGSNAVGKTIRISAGAYHSIALAQDGSAWSWGWNGMWQLGNGSTTDSASPVLTAPSAQEVSAGGMHTLVVTEVPSRLLGTLKLDPPS
jgi:alpha-tubulin suppressor-like RCC1 family protein